MLERKSRSQDKDPHFDFPTRLDFHSLNETMKSEEQWKQYGSSKIYDDSGIDWFFDKGILLLICM